MRGYEDEYENWDEYETEGEDEEEEEEEEPEPQQTQEQLGYLELREKLKEDIRQKFKKNAGATNAGSRTDTFRKDSYGSFFGPSQAVIAPRVIQESRSLLENPDLAARIANKPHNNNKKSSGSASVSSKSQVKSRTPAVNGVKKKAEMIKNTRDYSFLLSDDAEVPAPAKNPPPRTLSAPKPEARPAQVPLKSKQVVNDHRREVDNGRHVRKPVVSTSQSRTKVPEKSSGKLPVEPRRQLGNTNGSGPGRPLAPKGGGPSKTSVPATRKVTPPVVKSSVIGSHRPIPSSQQPAARKPPPSSQLQSGVMHKRSPPRSQSMGLNKSSVQRRGNDRETSKPKVVPKKPLPPSREQVRRPPQKSSAHSERPKPKPKRRHDDEIDGEDAISVIRQMFRYNPSKFRDDDDVSDMEANFDDIQREEKRSEKIARKEDEEQLRLLEEEEERRRMRMAKKKQKLR